MSSQSTTITVDDDMSELFPDVNLMSDSGVVLDGKDVTREMYLEHGVKLYQAALKGDWKAAQTVFESKPEYVCARITKKLDTALHISAAAKHPDFVDQLVRKMHKDNLVMKNKDGNTALSFAAASGNVEIAKVMVTKNDALPMIRSNKELTPLHMAALLGHRDMVRFLLPITDDKLSSSDRINLLISTIHADMYDISYEIFMKHRGLALERDGNNETALHALSRKPLEAHKGEKGMWASWGTQWDKKIKPQSVALQLVKGIWEEIIKQKDEAISQSIGWPRRLLFDAAEVGNVEFLATLIRSYPDLVWKVDEQKYSIFHVAILNRQEKIFNLIYDIGAIKDLLATYQDKDGNNMLHLAAKSPPLGRLQCVSGAALQMQRELLWLKVLTEMFPQYAEAKNKPLQALETLSIDKRKEVRIQGADMRRNATPQHDEPRNKSGQTAQALFTETHEDLRKRGEDWMKNTANYCMVVAALITTVVFTAAFTVPGGNDNAKGTPILLHKAAFKAFAISDAISLVASSASILMFLSILTSRYAEEDFLRRLPFKLMVGITCLFISIAAMMVAFTASYFIIFKNGAQWAAPIASLACIPVALFAVEQYPLLKDIYSSTFKSSYLFGSNKVELY